MISEKANQIWQRDFINRERDALVCELNEYSRRGNSSRSTLFFLRSEVKRALQVQTLRSQLRAFLCILETLGWHIRYGGLKNEEAQDLIGIGHGVLRAQGVHPVTSNLSWLHSELRALSSQIHGGNGEHWTAAWENELSRVSARKEIISPLNWWLQRARLAERTGDLRGALQAYERVVDDHASPNELVEAQVGRMRLLRISGNLMEANAIANVFSEPNDLELKFKESLIWESLCRELQAAGTLAEPAAMARMVSAGKPLHRSEWLLEAALWAFAVRGRKWIEAKPWAPYLAKLETSNRARRREGSFLAEAAQLLRSCYGAETLLVERLDALGRMIDVLPRKAPLDTQLLFLAGALRWLVRARQETFAALVSSRYQTLSLTVSLGVTCDALGIVGDLTLLSFDDAYRKECSTEPLLRGDNEGLHMPRSRSGRLFEISKLALTMTGVSAQKRLERTCASEQGRKRLRQEEMHALAALAGHHLGAVKGTFMKLGQLVSHLAPLSLDESQQGLATLCDSSPPVCFSDMRSVLEEDFGAPIDAYFSAFNPTPIATGSIGQVYSATLRGGRDVAVKIQYPGIRDAIDSDLDSIAMLGPLLAKLLPNLRFKEIIRELRERMVEECDFRLEARNQMRFRESCADVAGVIVPEVMRDLSSDRVLVSELVRGLRTSEFCRLASQEERNAAGKIIFSTITRSIVRDRFFNADPHPGNFIFSDGKVCFVDFGCMKSWSVSTGNAWNRMIASAFVNDREMFVEAFRAMKVPASDDSFDFEYAWATVRSHLMSFCLRDEESQVSRDLVISDFLGWTFRNPSISTMSFPGDYIFGLRTYWGMFSVLSSLGASCNWRRAFLPLLG